MEKNIMGLKVQNTLNQLITIANNYAFEGAWNWKNTGSAGYLSGEITVLIDNKNSEEKFDLCAKELRQLLVNNCINSEWGWKDLSKPPRDLKIDLFAFIDEDDMSNTIDSFFNRK